MFAQAIFLCRALSRVRQTQIHRIGSTLARCHATRQSVASLRVTYITARGRMAGDRTSGDRTSGDRTSGDRTNRGRTTRGRKQTGVERFYNLT
jgi:hypothetical protein